jgi:hypothetical protein
MNGNARLLGIVTLVVGMAALWPQEAWSYSSGAFDNPTCNTCHNGGTAPTVSFMSNNAAVTTLAVPRGSVVTLALRVKSNSPIQKAAGFNVTSTSPAVVLRVPPRPRNKDDRGRSDSQYAPPERRQRHRGFPVHDCRFELRDLRECDDAEGSG